MSLPADVMVEVEDEDDNRPVLTSSAKMLLIHEGQLSRPVFQPHPILALPISQSEGMRW